MKIKPIQTPEEHEQALAEIERLWGSPEGTPEGDWLEVLVTLVEAYEGKHFSVPAPNPIAAIRFRLEQQSLDTTALIGILGSRARVHKVVRGDRTLSLPVIRRLHAELHIPAETLIQPIKKSKPRKAA